MTPLKRAALGGLSVLPGRDVRRCNDPVNSQPIGRLGVAVNQLGRRMFTGSTAGLGFLACATLLISMSILPRDAIALPCHGEGKHCYSIARLNGYTGEQVASMGGAYIFLGCLAVPEQLSNIGTDELWAEIGTNTWMEAGLITGGVLKEGKKFDATTPRFFVSYQRANISGDNAALNEHIGSEAPVLTMNWVEIKQSSPQKSKVWNGWTAGTGTVSAGEFPTSRAAERLITGLETTSNEGWNDAAFTGLFMYSPDGNEAKTEWSFEAKNGHHFSTQAAIEERGGGSFPQGYFTWENDNYEADFGYNFHGC